MSKTIGIAGMGWLGLPLAHQLQTLGYTVKGSVSTPEKGAQLRANGWDVFPMTLTEKGVDGNAEGFLKNVTDLVIMIPPGLRRNTGSDYVLKMTHFLEAIVKSEVQNVIFISSTSVYGDDQGTVTEKDTPKPENEAGRQLKQVEQLFFAAGFNATVVRFGGLYGGSRQPVRYLAGRENLSGSNAPVNLIHRDDCINILSQIILKNSFGHIFNAVHPDHPTKEVYYTQKARELGLTPPHFAAPLEGASYKQVDSDNLSKILGYSFNSSL